MNEFTTRRERSVQVMAPKQQKKQLSITTMTDRELNEIDKFQNINRGFYESSKEAGRNC